MPSDDAIDEEFAIAAERTEEPRKILDQAMIREPIRQLKPLRPPICITKDRSAAEVVDLMRTHRIGSVLVTEQERLVGIVTEHDVLCKAIALHSEPEKMTVEEIMTADPATLKMDDPIVFALNKMEVGGFRHVPLVDEEHRPVGVVSVRHIVRHVVDFFAGEVMNLPPEPGMDVGRNREGA